MLFLALIGACSFTLGSCYGEDDPSPPPDDDDGEGGQAGAHATNGGPITGDPDVVDRFLREYAASICVMYRPCCVDEGAGYDGEGCTEWMYDLVRGQSEGQFLPDAAAHCLAVLDDARLRDPDRCKAVPSFDEAIMRPECRAVFLRGPRGGGVLGDECSFASDCASSTLGEVTCFEKRCVLQRQGAAEEGPCLFSSDLVAGNGTEVVTCSISDGLYCNVLDDVCEMLGEVGDACPHLGACKEGSICLLDHCTRLPRPGEICLRTHPGLCARGSACDEDTAVCGPAFETGDACLIDAQCASGACRSEYCADPEFLSRMSCTGEG